MNLKSIIVPFFVITGIIAVVVVVITLSSQYLNQKYADAHDGCFPNQTNHVVTIKDSVVSPLHTDAPRCDTLTIVNRDMTRRMIAFGLHEKHVAYDGIEEKMLDKDQTIVVTLIQTGNFRFHDHDHDEVEGTFSVK